MSIAYFNGNLSDYLGADARQAFSRIGLSDSDFRQITADGTLHSFIRIVGDFDVTRCSEVLTASEANARMLELFEPEYFITNETIFSASLNSKIASGEMDLDLLDESMSQSQQYAWFKSLGVKGIGQSKPPAEFTE